MVHLPWRQRLDEWYWRWIDYRVFDGYVRPWRNTWRRRWQALQAHLPRPSLAHNSTPKEAPRMEETDLTTVAPVVLGRAMIAQFDARTAAAIVAAVREDLAATFQAREQALAAREAELEEAYERRRVRLEDRLAQERRQLEDDAEARIELETEHRTADALAEAAEQVQEARAQRTQAREHRDEAVDALLGLVRQVFGPAPRQVVPYSRGLTEVDQYRLNGVLASRGLRLRSRSLTTKDGYRSARQVQTLVAADRVEGRVLFWLDSAPVAGVKDEDDADEAPLTSPEGSAPI